MERAIINMGKGKTIAQIADDRRRAEDDRTIVECYSYLDIDWIRRHQNELELYEIREQDEVRANLIADLNFPSGIYGEILFKERQMLKILRLIKENPREQIAKLTTKADSRA